MILRGVAIAPLACCIWWQGRNRCHVRSVGASAYCATTTMLSNFPSSVFALKICTSFLRLNAQCSGLGFRLLSPIRSMGSDAAKEPDKARGGLPRFHVDSLPALEGMIARVEGDEFSHMTKVLRMKVDDRMELFDGRGGIVSGQLLNISRSAAEVVTLEKLHRLSPAGPHWHVAAAFCSLKGGRAEWLVEKCTELGARTLTPLLTQRSSSVSSGRTDRWQRIALAATKQCQRLHSLDIEEPTSLESFLPQISRAEVAFVATAGAPPLYEVMSRVQSSPQLQRGMLFIGPEGDFTPDELNSLVSRGAAPVGLGPRRLRVETAAVAMLAVVMLKVETNASTNPPESDSIVSLQRYPTTQAISVD